MLAEACGRRVPAVESATAPAVWVAAVALALASDAAPPQDGSGLAAAPESELEPEMAVSVSPREEPANRGAASGARGCGGPKYNF